MDDNQIWIDFSDGIFEERYQLAIERISEFPGTLKGNAAEYFTVLRDLALLCGKERRAENCCRKVNELLFRDVSEEGYHGSFLDPDTAAEKLGDAAQLLSLWYAEFRGIIPFSFENRVKDVTVLLETTIQLFSVFEERTGHAGSAGYADILPELSDIIYSYLYDYAEEFMSDEVRHDADPACSFALDLVMHADLTDTSDHSYLYAFGEQITEEELTTARMLASLPEEMIRKMASAFTEGYIRGFEATGKDIRKKSVVSCYLPLGFERFMREAVLQFEKAGLKTVINRHPARLLTKRSAANVRPGFYGAFNPEYEYDHKEDLALFWGEKLKAKKLQALKNAYEENRQLLKAFSGRACVEIFGAGGSEPVRKKNAPAYHEHQLAVLREYAFRANETAQAYMPEEETSFTIIAWPTVSIAKEPEGSSDASALQKRYREIFEEFVRINTLPEKRWQQIQQCLADTLDRADYVEVLGAPGNDTDIRVQMHALSDPQTETNFENCLADVNIPVGEVFTSPVLKGTNGVIHAGRVYIKGCSFRDLKIRFEDGRVADYSCGGFEDPEQGRELIRKVIFRDRDALPMGEFAIGTNTAAFAAALRYGIEDKMPVLIAEKTGPHFAVGDTCYSYEEDLMTFNPDGKRITARENECSALRHTDPEKAYFQVHTDITLPYGGIGSITAVNAAERIVIIENGRFVLSGTEELNDAFTEN